MQQEDESSVSESESKEVSEPSRRTFLKVSAATGAALAALVAGAHFIPAIAKSSAMSNSSLTSTPSFDTNSAEAMILVLNGDALDVYKGESKYEIKDSSLASRITSNVNGRLE